MMIHLVSNTVTSPQSKKARVLETLGAMEQWPHWHEVYLNCLKESPLSYTAFVEAVRRGDSSEEAFEKALRVSQMTPTEFDTYLPEYQKFMALQVAYEDVGMLSDGVDRIWHAHMLISYRYQSFCVQFFGDLMHHMPCSLYELYGVTRQEARDNCLSGCNPTTCKPGEPGCKKVAPDADPQAIQSGILHSAQNFVDAYTEVFGGAPYCDIWNQLRSTQRLLLTP